VADFGPARAVLAGRGDVAGGQRVGGDGQGVGVGGAHERGQRRVGSRAHDRQPAAQPILGASLLGVLGAL